MHSFNPVVKFTQIIEQHDRGTQSNRCLKLYNICHQWQTKGVAEMLRLKALRHQTAPCFNQKRPFAYTRIYD